MGTFLSPGTGRLPRRKAETRRKVLRGRIAEADGDRAYGTPSVGKLSLCLLDSAQVTECKRRKSRQLFEPPGEMVGGKMCPSCKLVKRKRNGWIGANISYYMRQLVGRGDVARDCRRIDDGKQQV